MKAKTSFPAERSLVGEARHGAAPPFAVSPSRRHPPARSINPTTAVDCVVLLRLR